MVQSRVERRGRVRERRRRYYAIGAAALAVLGLVAVGVGVGLAESRAPLEVPDSVAVELPEGSSTLETSVATEAASGLTEVPGMSEPTAREPTGLEPTAREPAASSSRYVVCLDPGHQTSGNSEPEPVGPGSSETKAKVTGGAAGVVTGQAEYELNLDVALRVKRLLEPQGVKVVLTRSSSDIDISNAERAEIANDVSADLLVRIHADSNTNADINGVSTLYPAGNEWVQPIEAASLAAARVIHEAVLASTGAADHSIVKRSDLAGFNWSTVPAVLVEMGFLSNPVEDRQLAEGAYRDKVAQGIANGVMEWLER